jgi:hypothetical protein
MEGCDTMMTVVSPCDPTAHFAISIVCDDNTNLRRIPGYRVRLQPSRGLAALTSWAIVL